MEGKGGGVLPNALVLNWRSREFIGRPALGFFVRWRSLAAQKAGSMTGDRGKSPTGVSMVLLAESMLNFGLPLSSRVAYSTTGESDAGDDRRLGRSLPASSAFSAAEE